MILIKSRKNLKKMYLSNGKFKIFSYTLTAITYSLSANIETSILRCKTELTELPNSYF